MLGSFTFEKESIKASELIRISSFFVGRLEPESLMSFFSPNSLRSYYVMDTWWHRIVNNSSLFLKVKIKCNLAITILKFQIHYFWTTSLHRNKSLLQFDIFYFTDYFVICHIWKCSSISAIIYECEVYLIGDRTKQQVE